ncbi:glycosyltransferase family 4 protein [Sphingobium sp. H39-3-25]|uniref:glycosyltransferase family 4 protein n=1 Tax=Sphingobium arseniciresistens TaxID=3030834 RepID=UPI0023B90429|nr:glycosyltransferase family 4 protein [Sphingobium arseniciresistens]
MPDDQRPPRILHLHSSFNLGGKEARAVRLMNLWGDRLRHSILNGVPAQSSARAAIDPAIDVDFPLEPALAGRVGVRRLHALARFMATYDLVLSYNWGAMDGVMAHRLFSPVMRLPPIIHHEDGFNEDEASGLKPSRNRYRRLALGTCRALVVPSHVLDGVARNFWKQPEDRLHLIPNGIPIDDYAQPPKPHAIPGLERSPGKLLVGTLAGLRPVKNIRRLVRAVAPLKDRLQLVIVGEGADRDAIVAEARQLGLDDLHMPGFMAQPGRFIGLFDIFALSSDSEQFPISLVEAMAAGLPVVSTDVGDVMMMVTPENRDMVVATTDESAFSAALHRLAEDPALRKRLGTANRAKAITTYGEPAMVDAYARLYGEALARPALLR